ncbi:MAG: hypothetical protein KIT18_11920 [Burkholderiales bacterium]|nr:hypothetical protein [Burkholderiales bacterium]
MLWLLIEAGLALAILLFIVWWTWPRGSRPRDDARERNDKGRSNDEKEP